MLSNNISIICFPSYGLGAVSINQNEMNFRYNKAKMNVPNSRSRTLKYNSDNSEHFLILDYDLFCHFQFSYEHVVFHGYGEFCDTVFKQRWGSDEMNIACTMLLIT